MPSETLELRDGLSGPRYYLASRPLAGGTPIQLCFSGGWVTGRFEWSGDYADRPRMHCSIELCGGGTFDHSFEIPEDAIVRWP
ncbi:MAG: hypothetical protein HY898_12845 [Deltaproteobacteria bacterium]|nr:hypothetical protein [Deltaproteobacteria bacterium]